ncbi:uncharacterized protein LOC62_03G004457 [Vanrija pseudolonga]|uniref:Uncharacterized protein n=1 Tax=Vanrija pseudolonga TaxID=143232 RepID=A0AAF0Y619_9TREE|nr:hypothetical protein LOC62_03G004457 [Vanrija pseudolonga]
MDGVDNVATASAAPLEAPPPLPNDVRDAILSHLLPPAPPLPVELLARSFIERLTFLPPAEDDIDAQLSPFPTGGTPLDPNPLATALDALSGGFTLHPTQYTFDGEMLLARSVISPEHGYGGAVETQFEHDAKRGWTYRGSKPKFSLGDDEHDADHRGWVSHIENVSYSDDTAPEDYWAGFTPPSQRAELPGDNDEDDYWAQYGAGAEPEREVQTPAKSNIAVAGPETAATLSLFLQGLVAKEDDEAAETEAPAPAPVEKEPSPPGVLEQKIRAKVRNILMRAWSAFAADTDAEAAGFDWLRICRGVNERPSWGNGATTDAYFADARTAVLTARVEAAKEVFSAVDDSRDGFWRLVEDAIKIHTSPVLGDNEAPFEF